MKRSREPEEASPEEPPSAIPGGTIPSENDNRKGKSKSVRNDDREMSQPAAKITELDPSANANGIQMSCSLPPHKDPVIFSSYDEYETHYRDQHTNRCLVCRKNFPSAYLLGLHIEETHDSFAMVRRERGERTYSCFVEGCDRKCSTPQKRKMHLIDKHMYPKNFFFAITREGIDGRRSLLQERRRRGSSAAAMPHLTDSSQERGRGQDAGAAARSAESGDTHPPADSGRKSPEQQPDQAMDDLSSAMSSLQFVPSSIRFGRGRRAGFARQ
ncbi:hypothetical protein BT67DRAFT_441068 [Trichocladium antarcticum]|uniref:C2H2-type domain-containing protein n=1 Tax=Trichocladium antarcticum TaxID=1450529 RepID=A0AAN6ZEI3_9PEZI|nr:hypothetical protein BT67DRAFT_441068 [Trichocladium antarcticum]